MTANAWFGLAILCLVAVILILDYRVRRERRVSSIMDYLLYEEMRLRSAGVDDEDVISMSKWEPLEDIMSYHNAATIWLRKDDRISLGFTDGREIWWTDGAIDPDAYTVIAEGMNKVSIRVEFDDDGEEEPAAADDATTEPETEN